MIKTNPKWLWLIFLFLFLLFNLQITVPTVKQMDFSKGMNLNGWFVWQFGNNPRTFYNENDAKQLKNLGFTYVRIPVDPEYIWDYENDQLMHMSEIKRAIDINNSQGLAVTLDLHPTEKITGKQNDPSTKQEMYSLWSALSKELKNYPLTNYLLNYLMNRTLQTITLGVILWINPLKLFEKMILNVRFLIDSNTFSHLETLFK